MTKRVVSLVLLTAGVGLFGCVEREQELTRTEQPVVADPYRDEADDPYRDRVDAEDRLRDEPTVEPVGGLDDDEGLREVGRERRTSRTPATDAAPDAATPPVPPADTTQTGAMSGAKQGVAMLHSAEGQKAGTVRLVEEDGQLTVKAELTNVESPMGGATMRIAEHGDCDSLMGADAGGEAADAEEAKPGEEATTAEETTTAETTTAETETGKDLASTEITFASGQMTAEQKLSGVGFEGADSVIGHAVVIETKGEGAETFCGVVGIDRK